MKKIILFTVFILGLSLAALYLFSLREKVQSTDKALIATTIFPLFDITRQIAGDAFQVEVILPPGASPHSYDASPSDMKKIQNAEILFMIGHGIDDWSRPLAESAGIQKTVVVDRDIPLLTSTEDGITGTDPHYWLSGTNGILIASHVRDELSRIYPDNTSVFQENFLAFEDEVHEVEATLRSEFSTKNSSTIATFHNAWGYFAAEYGLTVSTTFEEFPGESPTPAYLTEFSDTIRNNNISFVFAEPQFSTKQIEPLASDLGLQIRIIDPIGGTESIQSFRELLLYNGLEISKSL